jgi:hypothetical protein
MASKARTVPLLEGGPGAVPAQPVKSIGGRERNWAHVPARTGSSDSALRNSPRLPTAISSTPPNKHIWKTRPLFAGAKKIEERIISNLCPVVEIPKYIFSAESLLQNESDVLKVCGCPGPVPFLVRAARIYTLAPLTRNSALFPALKESGAPAQELLGAWLGDHGRSGLAIDLLNRFLRYHSWKRGMRFDERHRLFYFTRSKPKKLWWETGGKLLQREVTAPHMKWNQIEEGVAAEFQCGWKHEAVRAEFTFINDGLFLQMEPAWFLTELDGKTPATTQSVGPANPDESLEQTNRRMLQTLQFWSGIFAKGHRELRIDTGANPIRVRLTSANDFRRSRASTARADCDQFTAAETGDAQGIPELVPIAD